MTGPARSCGVLSQRILSTSFWVVYTSGCQLLFIRRELTLLQYILNTADLRTELDLIPASHLTPEAKAVHVHTTTAYMTSLVSSILSVARVPSVALPVATTCYEVC